jgi:isocitrate dehydrogenase
MKMTDGLFHRVFDEIGAEYPDIIQDHYIIDIGSAKVAASPHIFDVIVTTNLYGDIISDIAAEVTGSVGLAGSSNVGEDFAMFEAIHGSAPDIAGKGIANPSGLLNGAIMMLTHIGQPDVAEKIQNAWLVTLEDGIHTGEIYREGSSKKKVGTKEFSEAVIARLGQKPVRLRVADYSNAPEGGVHLPPLKPICFEEKKLVGVDLFLDWQGLPDVLGDKIVDLAKGSGLTLKIISNRGVKVWPHGHPDTFTADHWRLRLFAESGVVDHIAIYSLANKLAAAGLDVIKIENLYTFNDKAGYSLAQGE